MDPVLSALLRSWELRPSVIIVLVLAGTIYTLGWRRLRGSRKGLQRSQHYFATNRRLAAYLGGLAILGLALLSPIDVLAVQLFAMHMVQHLLLIMAAAPLLLLANPFPFMMWGLPENLRRRVAGLFRRRAAFRRGLRAVTSAGLAWMIFVAVFVGWHDPRAYNLALQYDWVHDLEHLTFFGSAVLFWWHVTQAGPRLHRRFSAGARIGYLLAAVPVNIAAGAFIAFSGEPIYTYYTTVPRLWGLTVMQDQMLGGVIMWVPGSMMYIVGALILIGRLLQLEENKPALPESEWATDEAMIAPGWKK